MSGQTCLLIVPSDLTNFKVVWLILPINRETDLQNLPALHSQRNENPILNVKRVIRIRSVRRQLPPRRWPSLSTRPGVHSKGVMIPAWIRIRTQIFTFLVIPNPDSDPVKIRIQYRDRHQDVAQEMEGN